MTLQPPPRTPIWVKIFAVIAVVILVVFLAMVLSDNGKHGPGRHMPHGVGPILSN